MDYQNLILERDGAVATVTLNRPKALNALSQAVIAELGTAIDEIAADDSVRAVIVTGAGERAFAAGADVREFTAAQQATDGTQLSQRTHAVLQRIAELPKPVIAAINGFALGGGLELALACDIRLAADTAAVGQPEIKLGIHPGWGGTTRLVRLVGPGIAKLIVFSGDQIGAEEARSLGIIERVVPATDLMREARALAAKFATLPPLALAAAKQSINRSHDMALADANAYEATLFGQTLVTEDAREGIQAFLEKRAAVWKSK